METNLVFSPLTFPLNLLFHESDYFSVTWCYFTVFGRLYHTILLGLLYLVLMKIFVKMWSPVLYRHTSF